MVNIQDMSLAPGAGGDWLGAFYEAQYMLWKQSAPLSGNPSIKLLQGTIFFPKGDYYFSNTLQLFGDINLIGEGASHTILNVDAAINTDINAKQFGDGLVLHRVVPDPYGTGVLTNTNSSFGPAIVEQLTNPITLATIPIKKLWEQSRDVGESYISKLKLSAQDINNDNLPTGFSNPEDPDAGYGHGIVVHKRIQLYDCVIEGFPGDGVRIAVGVQGTPEARRYLSTLPNNPPNLNHPDSQYGPNNLEVVIFASSYSPTPTPPVFVLPPTTASPAFNDLDLLNTDDNNSVIALNTITGFSTLSITDIAGNPISYLTFDINTTTSPNQLEATVIALPPLGTQSVKVSGVATTTDGDVNFKMRKSFQVYYCDDINDSYPYIRTNGNVSQMDNVSIRLCGRNGLYTRGLDANACQFTAVSAIRCGAWGILERSFLGNTYVGCFASENGTTYADTGDISSHLSGAVNDSVFIKCTAGTTVKIKNPSQWIGGSNNQIPAGINASTGIATANSGNILNQGSVFKLMRNHISFINRHDSDHIGGLGLGPSIGDLGEIFGMYYGTNRRKWTLRHLKNMGAYVFFHQNFYKPLYLTGALDIDAGPPSFERPIKAGSAWLQKPFFMSHQENIAPKVRVGVVEGFDETNNEPIFEQASYDFVTPSVNINTGQVGDIIYNNEPTPFDPADPDNPRRFAGWICTRAYDSSVSTSPDDAKAIWTPFGLIP